MRKGKRGWLAVGLVIIAILVGIAMMTYRTKILNSKEAVLRANLLEMRRAIDQSTTDKQRAPQSLQDLIEAGYFRQLPIDPMTNSNSSWQPVVETVVISPGKTERGVTDVHSGSASISSNGTTYQAW